ncbi:hypothetical protein ABK040_003727 [Willaertia magna]
MTDNILSPFFLTNFNNYHLNNHFDSFITFSLNNNLIINNNFTNNNNSTTFIPTFFSSIYFTAIYSGLLAGIVAITITILIEKLGSTLGALIGTIPTVVVFSVLGCSLDTQRKFPNDFEMKKVTMVEQLFSVPIGIFPSIYTTTLITIWFSQGEEVVMNSIGSMLLGSASVGLFAMLSCITILYWNILAGMIFSYNFAVLLITLPSFYYLRWRKEVALERNRLLLLAEGKGKVNNWMLKVNMVVIMLVINMKILVEI